MHSYSQVTGCRRFVYNLIFWVCRCWKDVHKKSSKSYQQLVSKCGDPAVGRIAKKWRDVSTPVCYCLRPCIVFEIFHSSMECSTQPKRTKNTKYCVFFYIY